jgi:DNA gyrase subunit A
MQHYLTFRREVVIRRTIYDLAQAEARAHILEGFAIALDHLDEVIALIRSSDNAAAAREQLMSRFGLSERQAQAILDMRLRALTAMERQKVIDELTELRALIADLKDLLASESRILEVVVDEIVEIQEKYGDDRRTELAAAVEGISNEDLIVEEDMVVTLSHLGYIKRNPITQYRAQRRGGKGARGMQTRDEDFVQHLFVASTHAYILFFTNKGRVHWLKVHELPQLGRAAKGKAIVNVLHLDQEERVQTIQAVRSFEDAASEYILLCTRKGLIKKTSLTAYSNPRRAGIIAINLADDDELMAVGRTDGENEIIIASATGKSIRFNEAEVRPMGRTAAGVRGIALAKNDQVVGMEVLSPDATILTATERGYGKRTPLGDYRIQKRGGQGIITIRTNERNGKVVGIAQVVDDDELMLVTNSGKVLRCPVNTISTMGRATQGVRVMNLAQDEMLVAVERLAEGGSVPLPVETDEEASAASSDADPSPDADPTLDPTLDPSPEPATETPSESEADEPEEGDDGEES